MEPDTLSTLVDASIDPAILGIEELAKLLRCKEEMASTLLAQGVLPGLRFGRSWIVPRQSLLVRLNKLALDQAEDRAAKLKPSTSPEPSNAPASPLAVVEKPLPQQAGRGARRPVPPLAGYLAAVAPRAS